SLDSSSSNISIWSFDFGKALPKCLSNVLQLGDTRIRVATEAICLSRCGFPISSVRKRGMARIFKLQFIDFSIKIIKI
ncbi:MAG: hypothetical protein ACFFG0_17645, partial [Candidatus Thorarchaeota archaeon]